MGELAAALATLQTKLPHIGKDNAAVIQPSGGGRTYGYKYADLATVSKAVLPLLGELGLSFTCQPTIRDDGKFVLHYALMHMVEEEGIYGDYPLPAGGSPQQIGSAITYARRYCLCAVTGAAPDEDDDDGQAAERADGLPVNADGSLSRSRTTDDQKNAAGVMTGPQQTAHTQLAKPPANTQPVERSAKYLFHDHPADAPHTANCGPMDPMDLWMDGPAGLAPQDDPEDQPGTALAEQIHAIKALYTGQFGIKDRDKMLETTRQFLGLDMLSSHTRLSYRQAGDLLLAMRTKLKAAK